MSQPPIEEESPVIPGWSDAPVTGDRVDVSTNPIIVGDPDGAHVEVSDTAVEGVPGVQVVPADTTGYTSFPGVTYSHTGMMMWGGRDTTDRESEATLRPDRVYLRSRGGGDPTSEADILVTEGLVRLRSIPDVSDPRGDGVRVTLDDRALNIGARSDTGWSSINVLGTNARIANESPDGMYTEINTDWASARVAREAADGTRRALVVDDHGVWAETDRDGVQRRYNLEETAQDSGWQAFSTVAGMDSYALAWRNKGGVIYMRGTVTATWSAGWTTVATNLPVEMRPAIRVVRQAPSTSEQGLYFRMGNDGVLEFNKPTAGTRTADLSAIFYPAD